MLSFEFDLSKSRSNKEKHGIDFEEAQSLWFDERRIEIPARSSDEARWIIVGRIADKVWAAVITYRGGSIRLISARRSRPEEETLYEGC